jgi:hypothetical protein
MPDGILAKLLACLSALGDWSLRLEKRCRSRARDKRAHPKTSVAVLALVTIGLSFLPLLVTGATSFGEAEDICHQRQYTKLKNTFGEEEWKFDDLANRHLFPRHLNNCIASAMSLLGFAVWIFFSPHTENESAEALDRTCIFTRRAPRPL